MKESTKSLYEITAMANDAYFEKHPNAHTTVGLMDKILRRKGIAADAVTVDNIENKVRVIFIILDDQPETVGIGVGNTLVDDINVLSQLPLNSLTVNDVLALLDQHLVKTNILK